MSTCKQSSLVGVMMMAMGPSPSSSSSWSAMCLNRGRRKARVLPEPVLAIPIISRPLIIAGIAWAFKNKFYRNNQKTILFSIPGLELASHSWTFSTNSVSLNLHHIEANSWLALEHSCLYTKDMSKYYNKLFDSYKPWFPPSLFCSHPLLRLSSWRSLEPLCKNLF